MFTKGEWVEGLSYGVPFRGIVFRDEDNGIVFVLVAGKRKWFHAQSLTRV